MKNGIPLTKVIEYTKDGHSCSNLNKDFTAILERLNYPIFTILDIWR